MTTLELYRQELEQSIKELFNTKAQVTAYINTLRDAKQRKIISKIVGKTYSLDDLYAKDSYYYKYYENTEYKAVLVDSLPKSYNFVSRILDGDGVFDLTVLFIRNPYTILNSKLKLTEKERKLLCKLKEYWDIPDGESRSYLTYKEIDNLDTDLKCLKHKLHILIQLTWSYDLNDLLQDNFTQRGLKAESVLI